MMKRFAAMLLVFLLLPVSALCPAGAEDAYQPLQYGDQGDLVAEIQQLLSDLGYYSGRVTGNFLDGTRASVKKFQKEYGLEETGVVDGMTEVLLRSAEYRVLRAGDDGEDVTRLQQALNSLGYLDAKATGKFRSATEAAVKDFQRKNGLEVTGAADMALQKLLFSGCALPKDAQPTATPDPEEDLGDINDMVLAGDGEDVVEAYEKKLTRGVKGEDVKKVQTRLTELGYFDGPISGNYMNQTMAAVKAFQIQNGLREQNGITDEITWNAIFNTDDVVPPGATPRPTPEPTPVPYAITVDVRNQATIVYGLDENGEHTVPVKWFICSTGMKATPSTVGEWVLNGRHARWCYFSKWGSHAQYWTRINKYIAFHSVIYNSVNTSALSVKSYNKLGQRASHGCVRLLVKDAKWVYENIGEGTVVTITEDRPNDEELRKAVQKPPLNSSKTGPSSTPVPTAAPEYVSGGLPPLPFRSMKKGSEGEDVYWLQCKLGELGYYTGAIPMGGYYARTEAAVKAFQKDHGLSATGTADERTLEAIYADVLAANPTPPPAEEPAPAATPKP